MTVLNESMRRQFQHRGFLLLPSLFSEDEIAHVRSAVAAVAARKGPEVIHEPDSDVVRMVYGAHRFNEAFGRLARHPRWLEPVQALMGGPVYIHQSRLNTKAAFHGGPWTWHQDYATWSNRDGLLEPRAFMVAILLDQASTSNGPLMLVPGSHRCGLIADAVDNQESSSYTVFEIGEERLAQIVRTGGIELFVGPPGSVLITHANMVHGSAGNITPWPRRIFYLNVAAVDNPPTKFDRPEHLCTRDWSAVGPLDDDCLRMLGPSSAAR
ncbi:MAG: phytanoyl-CoA dioxygenase family protein [Rhodospirillales bacterium]|nr:phytanoyl-CoA dioxygenase family protein [Rhodospirillales bacterium]